MALSLASVLEKAGQPAEQLVTGDGSRLLFAVQAGRVLGLYPPGSTQSFLWTHPALAEPDQAKAYLKGSGWRSPGGHRLWLAPELHLFYPRFPDLSEYSVPPPIDPGRWTFERTDEGAALANRARIRHRGSGADIELEARREFRTARCPLEELPDGLDYAGYEMRSSLDILGNVVAPVGLWSLIQLPWGGEFFAPVRPGTKPRVYLGDIAARDLSVEGSFFRHHARASGIQKTAIHVEDIYGVAGYTWESGGLRSLVVVSFPLGTAQSYIDTPPDALDERGYALQTCNVDLPALGTFAELEHHTPAAGLAPDDRHSEELADVWAFRGPPEHVQAVQERLLAPDRT